jgi:hypothetical protein
LPAPSFGKMSFVSVATRVATSIFIGHVHK